MNKARKDLLILFLSLIIIGSVCYHIEKAYALDEFIDDYNNENYVQSKYQVVRNITFNCMELETINQTFLSGFNKRKPHDITGSTVGNTVNHVRPFIIYNTSGVDGTFAYRDLTYSKMYCGGNVQLDFDDIRFTEIDGLTELTYWKETYVAGNYAFFWVKIPSFIQNTNYTLYVYYDNALAVDTGDIKNTFRIGDDFEDGVLDTSIWTVGGTGTISEAGGLLTITGTSGYKYITSNLNITIDGSVYLKTNMKRTGGGHTTLQWYNTTHPLGNQVIQMLEQPNTNCRHRLIKDGVSKLDAWIRNYGVNNYYDFIFNWRVATASKIWIGGISHNYAVVGNLPRDCDKLLLLGDYQDTGITVIKYIFVKMQTNPEPVPKGWGSEEIAGGTGYYDNGHFYTTEVLTGLSGNCIVLLTNTTIPYNDIITVEFSIDNSTWVDHNVIGGSDIIVAGNESIDIRDLSYLILYMRFNFTDIGVDSTPRLYQIWVITNDVVSGVAVGVYTGWILGIFILVPSIAILIRSRKRGKR